MAFPAHSLAAVKGCYIHRSCATCMSPLSLSLSTGVNDGDMTDMGCGVILLVLLSPAREDQLCLIARSDVVYKSALGLTSQEDGNRAQSL